MIIIFCLLPLLMCMAQSALYPINHKNIDVFYAKYRYEDEFVGIKKFRGKLSRIRPQIIIPPIHETRRYEAYNHLLDSIGHIDWNNDTVVMVIPEEEIGDIDLVKSKKGIVCLYAKGYDMIDDDYYHGMYDFQEYLDPGGDHPSPPCLAKQDSIRSYALLSFDFDVISNVLKYSYSFSFASKYFVYRVIIDKGKIIDTKMLIVPNQVYWRSTPEDFPGQQYIDELKARYKKERKKNKKKTKEQDKSIFLTGLIFFATTDCEDTIRGLT